MLYIYYLSTNSNSSIFSFSSTRELFLRRISNMWFLTLDIVPIRLIHVWHFGGMLRPADFLIPEMTPSSPGSPAEKWTWFLIRSDIFIKKWHILIRYVGQKSSSLIEYNEEKTLGSDILVLPSHPVQSPGSNSIPVPGCQIVLTKCP